MTAAAEEKAREARLAALRKLREPFPPGEVGKLPKPYKRDSPKGQCRECHGYHGLPAAHLDYVGHAAITNRMLEVDPEWTWKPMARDAAGLPLIVNGNLWIELTICGVTRPGVGDAEGGNSLKIMIGDAIRNAGMRFGMGLDLWSKEDLHDFATAQGSVEHPAEDVPAAARQASRPAPPPPGNDQAEREKALAEFNLRIQQLGEQDLATFRQRWVEAGLPKLSDVNSAQFAAGSQLLQKLEGEIASRPMYADDSLAPTTGDYDAPPSEYYDDGVQSV